ncbi:MAG: hypothetical protein ACPHRO_06315, partial [Nannocystaceae bacterium]
CENVSECPDYGDNRLVGQCFSNDADVNNAPGVCVATWKPESCDKSNTTLPLGETFAAAEALGTGVYSQGCDPVNAGKRGCQPDPMTGCEAGTELQDGACQVPGSPVLAGVGGDPDLLGQDVLDQSCRFYFCNEDFVCDKTNFSCRPCDPTKPIGYGGCTEIWVEGAPSTIYMDQATLNGACKQENAESQDPAAFAQGLPTGEP